MTYKLLPWLAAALLYLVFPGPAHAICIQIGGPLLDGWYAGPGCKTGDNTQSSYSSPGEVIDQQTICMGGKCATVGGAEGSPLTAPAGWSGKDSPPATSTPQFSYTWNGITGIGGPTQLDGCTAMMNAANAQGPGVHGSPTDYPYHTPTIFGSFGGCLATKASGGTTIFDDTSSTVCPTGYTVGGGGTICNLTNAAIVQKPTDGKCNIIRSGNTYSGDPNDPDCSLSTSGGSAQALNLGVSGGTVTASQSGQTVTIITNTTTGATTITNSTANTNNTTTINTVNVSAPASSSVGGSVTGTAKTTAQGTGDLVDTTAKADPAACGAPGQPKCAVAVDETGTPTDAALADAVASFNTEKAATLAAITDLSGSGKKTDLGVSLSITWPTVTCTDPVIGVGSFLGTIPLCAKKADVNAVMSWIVWILGAFYLFGLIREIR